MFTNASTRTPGAFCRICKIADLFDGICDIECCGFIGKPERAAYDVLLARHDIDPERSIFFDDREVNLRIPFQLGMQTVLVVDQGDAAVVSHVHAFTEDVPRFLTGLLVRRDVVSPAGFASCRIKLLREWRLGL